MTGDAPSNTDRPAAWPGPRHAPGGPAQAPGIRVLIVTPDPQKIDAGGVPSYYGKIGPHLPDGADFFVVGRRAGRGAGIDGLRLVQDYVRFNARLRDGGYDLVVLNPSLESKSLLRETLLLLLAKRHRRRVIIFIRGWVPQVEQAIERHWRTLFRTVLGRADAFIVLGSAFHRTLVGWGIQRPIYIESTVAEPQTELPAAGPGDELAGPAGRPVRLLFISRILRVKGIYIAIEATQRLRERGLDVELVVAGVGAELQAAKDHVRERGIDGVRFLGYVKGVEKRRAFQDADILLLPTEHGEGMPNAVVEAMASGLPVVTRAVGGLNDFFENGTMGYLTDSTDPAEFVALLEHLVLDPVLRARMGARNRQFAERYFAAPTVAARLQALFAAVGSGQPQAVPSGWQSA